MRVLNLINPLKIWIFSGPSFFEFSDKLRGFNKSHKTLKIKIFLSNNFPPSTEKYVHGDFKHARRGFFTFHVEIILSLYEPKVCPETEKIEGRKLE